VTADSEISEWIYNLNGNGNVTFTPNTSIIPIIGLNHIIVYGNDTTNHLGYEEAYFSFFGGSSCDCQQILDYIVSLNATNMQYYNQLASSISALSSQIGGLNDLSAYDVWNYYDRTLTDYNQTEMLALLNDINLTFHNITGEFIINVTGSTGNCSIGNQTQELYRRLRNLQIAFSDDAFRDSVYAGFGFTGMASAQELIPTRTECSTDNTTLIQYFDSDTNLTDSYGSDVLILTRSKDVICEVGCEIYHNNQTGQDIARCRPTEFSNNLAFLFIIFMLIIVAALLYWRKSK
jgi:hypothetical protein